MIHYWQTSPYMKGTVTIAHLLYARHIDTTLSTMEMPRFRGIWLHQARLLGWRDRRRRRWRQNGRHRRMHGCRRGHRQPACGGQERHQQQGHDIDDLDQRIDGRASRILVRIAHGVARDGRLVRFGTLAAEMAI